MVSKVTWTVCTCTLLFIHYLGFEIRDKHTVESRYNLIKSNMMSWTPRLGYREIVGHSCVCWCLSSSGVRPSTRKEWLYFGKNLSGYDGTLLGHSTLFWSQSHTHSCFLPRAWYISLSNGQWQVKLRVWLEDSNSNPKSKYFFSFGKFSSKLFIIYFEKC